MWWGKMMNHTWAWNSSRMQLRGHSTTHMRYALGSGFVLRDPEVSGERVLRYLS
uniref:Uncharacterized protein n=1 Tax=Arundo donax TaxID=35708 RepID=A0A0A9E0B8_ARUDO